MLSNKLDGGRRFKAIKATSEGAHTKKPPTQCQRLIKSKGGDEGSRTLGLCHATAALSQLSYVPRTSCYFTYGSPTVNAQ